MLRQIDMYGHRISVQYRGKGTYTTNIGGGLTIFTVIVIIVNLVSVLHAFFTRSHQEESYRRFKRDLLTVMPETLSSNNFYSSVSSFQQIPASIGSWRAWRYGPYKDDRTQFDEELKLAECDDEFKAKSIDYYTKRFTAA